MVRARRAILEAGGAQRVQQLHAVLPGAAGPDRLRRLPVRAAGAGADPVAVELQPERDVGVDADDRRAAVDHVVLQAGAAARPEQGIAELFRERPAARPSRRTAAALLLDELLPGAGPRAEVARPPACPRPGGRPAIRAAHRWMLEHCEDTDGLGAIFPPMIYSVIALRCLGYEPRFARGRMGIEQLDDLQIARGRPGPGAAVRLAGLGHGDRHDRAGRRAACPPTIPPGAARSTGCSPRRCGTPATGRFAGRASSRPAGTSSSATSSIPTSTTPRWCCSPCSGRRWPTSRTSRRRLERGRRLAAGDAEPRRRLGGLRRRHRQPGADQGPVRRPQRDARPELRRHHGPGARAAGHSGLSRRPSGGRARPRLPLAAPRSPRAAGTAAGASTTSTAPGRSCRACAPSTSRWIIPRSSGRWPGSSRCSKPTAAGARPAGATTTRA